MDLRTIDLNLLVVGEAVVAEGSVTRAADRLGLTQSAVSHALARLRRVVGDDILVRGADGWEPTPRAREIGAVLGRTLSDIERVLDEGAAFDAASSRRRFTLHVSDYAAPLLAPLGARLRREAPDVTLDVRHFAGHPHRVEPEALYLQVADRPVHEDPAVERRALVEDTYVVLMSREHPLAGAELTLERYLGLAHIKISAAALGTSVIDEALARRGLGRSVTLTVPSWFAMQQVVASTDLVVAMPRRWAADPVVAAGCVWHPLPLPDVTFAVDLCWRRRDRHDPGHRWLRDLVVEVLAT